jgi:hypothetical protein
MSKQGDNFFMGFFLLWGTVCFLFLACAASAPPAPQQPVLPSVTTAEQFYMSFHAMPDSNARTRFIEKYPALARECFYKHIVRMITDISFKEATPTEYETARELGKEMATLYKIKFNDSTLEEVFSRISPLE